VMTAFEHDQDGTQFHPGRAWKLSSNLYDIYQCRMYSGKLLMMGRGTARNKFNDSFQARPRWNWVQSWSCLKAVVKPAWHIPVPNVQWKTPDDGQRNCPKHVQFLDKNKFGNLVLLLVLLKRNFSELTRLLSNLIGLHISFRIATGGKKKNACFILHLFFHWMRRLFLCAVFPLHSPVYAVHSLNQKQLFCITTYNKKLWQVY